MYEGDFYDDDHNLDWSADAAVAAGIMVLNDKAPADWRDRINLDTMNVESISRCPLAQVFGRLIGGYHAGLEVLGIRPSQAIDFGFDCIAANADELNDAWREELGR